MIITGNSLQALKELPDSSVDCCVTSPPYYCLRDYGVDGQIGLEASADEYIDNLSSIFTEVRRVLKDEGTLWLNLGDSYARKPQNEKNPGANIGKNVSADAATARNKRGIPFQLKVKDLIGIPWRVAFRLQQDGWYLRQDIIWNKPNVMPESIKDRCTKSHEYIFLLSKKPFYYFNHEAIKEPASHAHEAKYDNGKNDLNGSGKSYGGQGSSTRKFPADPTKRNKRSVWSVPTKAFKGAHFATFPTALITPCILAGCPEGGVVLDPFFGAGTTGLVARDNGRKYIGIELNPEYVALANQRLGL